MTIELAKQIQAVAREIALRRNVYPKWILAGKLKAETAKHELAAMEAVIETLKALQWVPVGERLPDDDLTVQVKMEDGEIWTGYHDGDDGWRYVSADPASGVQFWRAVPE